MDPQTPITKPTEPTTETNTNQTEEEIIKQLFQERDNYKQTNQAQRTEVNNIYSAYVGRMDDVKKTPYFEPVSIPKLRTEVSYIVPFIFSGNPEIEVEGVGEEDKTIAAVLEKIINFRFETIPNAYEKIESWVKQATTVGTSIIKPIWRFETKQNPDGTETPIVDEPDLEVPNILDCFYNPIVPDIDSQPSIIFRSVLPLAEVKNNPIYDYVGADGVLNREKIESGSIQGNNYDSSSQISGDYQLSKASEGLIEVYERMTKDRIQTVAAGKKQLLLRDKPWDYGFINAVKLVHEPSCIPNLFDGFGVGQNTMGLGKAFHSIINQTKQNIALTNSPAFIGKKGARIDKRQLVILPGSIIEADGDGPLQENIQPIAMPDIRQGAIAFIDKLDDEHKRASGANDLVQGAASNKTLGQDQMASSYSSNRFELIQRRFKQALSDLAELLIKMELQNLQSPDSPILRIFPQELRVQIYQLLINEAGGAEYDIKIKGDTTIAKNKDVQIKQLTDIFNLGANILPPENQMAFLRKLLELRGVDGVDELVPDPQVYAQQMQQQQMMQQQQAMNSQMMQQEPTQQGINSATYGK